MACPPATLAYVGLSRTGNRKRGDIGTPCSERPPGLWAAGHAPGRPARSQPVFFVVIPRNHQETARDALGKGASVVGDGVR